MFCEPALRRDVSRNITHSRANLRPSCEGTSSPRPVPRRALLAASIAALLAALPAAQASGPNLVVTACGDAAGAPGTLRDAVAHAPDGATIDLTQLPPACSVITLEDGAIATARGALTIRGLGRDALTIDANANGAVFDTKYSLSIEDVTIAHGYDPAGGGGCLVVGGNLTLERAAVTGCVSGDGANAAGYGGGILVLGDMTAVDSIVGANLARGATARGGGAYVGGSAQISRSAFARNEAQGGVYDASGGGLDAAGDVVLRSSRFLGNRAVAQRRAAGGAIRGAGGILAITDASAIDGNRAEARYAFAYGGGIVAGSYASVTPTDVLIQDSTISGNTAFSACDAFTVIGGGVLAFGTIDVEASAVHDNAAIVDPLAGGYAAGGGLATRRYGAAGRITLVDATVSGNRAIGGSGYGFAYGGGVAAINQSPIVFANSTIAFNEVPDGFGGGAVGSGASGVASRLDSTIVAMNAAPNGADLATPDFGVPFAIDGERNLVMTWTSDVVFTHAPLAADPQLLPLAANGGPTPTHALLPWSPAVDAGTNPLGLAGDQRGAPFSREIAAPDIGAFELQASP